MTGVSTAAEPQNKQVQSGLDFIDFVFNGGVLNGMNVARFFAHGDNGEQLWRGCGTFNQLSEHEQW